MKITQEEYKELKEKYEQSNREWFRLMSYCTRCGKPFSNHHGISGNVSSIKFPGLYDHFPNCPREK